MMLISSLKPEEDFTEIGFFNSLTSVHFAKWSIDKQAHKQIVLISFYVLILEQASIRSS